MNRIFIVSLCLFSLSMLTVSGRESLSCRNEKGVAVDWFIVYKIPYLQKNPNKLLSSGFSYAFISGPTLGGRTGRGQSEAGWTLSSKLITSDDSIFAQTLNPLFLDRNSYSHLMYSDAPSQNSLGKESTSLAHAKGVLALDSNTGFWLIHSVPQFPDAPIRGKKYSYPRSGRDNGQSALCISIPTGEARKVIRQLFTMRANVYSNFTSRNVVDSIPELDQLLRRKWTLTPTEGIVTIKTVKGEQFKSFARSPRSALRDLYVDLMAPELKTDLLVETWRKGAGTPLTSNCTYQFKVNNVESVELTFTPRSGVSRTSPWSYTEDHSKWAVAVSKHTTCVGDINRMASQAKRGGGSVCLTDSDVWRATSKSVHDVETCPRKGKGNQVVTTTRPNKLSTNAPRAG